MKIYLFVLVCMMIIVSRMLLISNLYAGYVEEREIIVVDAKTRAIEGASVIIEHQLNHIDGIVNTTPFFTDASGTASIRFINNEYQEVMTDYDYKAYIKYMSHEEVLSLTAGEGPKSVSVQLPLYALIVHVYDQHNHPLRANVTVFNITRETNDYGLVTFAAEDGEHTVQITFDGVTKNYTGTVAGDDAYISAPISVHNVTVEVVDDTGKKIDGLLTYRDQTCNLTAGESCVLTVIGEDEFTVSIEYGNKTFTKTQTAKKNVKIIVDSNPPLIEDVRVRPEKTKTVIYAYIHDPGVNPSGIDDVNLPYVSYTANYQGGFIEEGQATMLPFGNGYSVDLPIREDCQFEFVIYAKDRAGNLNSYSGSEVLVFEVGEEPKEPGVILPSNGGNATTENFIMSYLSDIRNIIAIIVGVILLFSVWSFWRRSRRNI